MTEPELLPAFVLHTRPYRETSQLVDLFVASMGKVTVVAKGSRSSRSSLKGLLQPFLPLHIHFGGKSSLKTLLQLETRSTQIVLQGERLFSGLYLNELLYYLLEPDAEYPGLFSSYFQVLLALSEQREVVSILLRQFELLLLQQLGYGTDFCYAADSGLPIDPDSFYRYELESGFIATSLRHHSFFSGREILGISEQDFSDSTVLAAARRFSRQAFAALLGNRPLKSRELYSAYIARRSE
ncbi:DNA repair protein RecO [Tolumonas lignilytica]|uniref:DNA repair protein RecO n=1 Tax=Tolumonas lignilytica TaxID=1283284 RepID=UPI000464AE9C|nr:DNA repair protein RecO [Tolumonas lignilytica]